MLVKPEQIQVHELKALPNKAKVQGMVAMRQPPSAYAVSHSAERIVVHVGGGVYATHAHRHTHTHTHHRQLTIAQLSLSSVRMAVYVST